MGGKCEALHFLLELIIPSDLLSPNVCLSGFMVGQLKKLSCQEAIFYYISVCLHGGGGAGREEGNPHTSPVNLI